MTQLFPRRVVNDRGQARRTTKRLLGKRDHQRRRVSQMVEAGTYAEYQKRKRVTGSDGRYTHKHWTQAELGALLLPLTARELAVMLGRTLPGVEQKIQKIKDILAYKAGALRLSRLSPRRSRDLKLWKKPGYHGKLPKASLDWLIDHHGLHHETFRRHDIHGNIIPTMTREQR